MTHTATMQPAGAEPLDMEVLEPVVAPFSLTRAILAIVFA